MSTEEKERVCKQQQCLGEEGLKEKGQQLEKAIAQNEVHMHLNTVANHKDFFVKYFATQT